MNQIVSLFMFRCGDYEKVKQDVWEENWKAMRLYSVVALVAFGVITLVSVFSLCIGKFKWVYLVYTFLSLIYFCISRCQLRSFLGKKLVVYSFFAALLLFGIITGTLITPEEFTVNYIVFMVAAPLLFTARTAVMNGLILSSMLLYIGLAFFAQHNPILSKNLVDVLNQRVALLRINDDTNTYFLFSIINRYQDYFKKLGAGSSQLNISRGIVENFEVAYPNVAEQRMIADYFQSLDHLITLHQRESIFAFILKNITHL